MLLAEMIIPLGFVAEPAPRAPDQHGHHFCRTQVRLPTARITGKVLGSEPSLHLLPQVVNRDVELEQHVRTAYSLLSEQGRLLAVRGIATVLIAGNDPALQSLPGIAFLSFWT